MKNAERADLLAACLRKEMHATGFTDRQEFVEWVSKVAPLLNFSAPYYNAFQDCVTHVHKTGLRSDTYTELLAHMESIVMQAITELRHNLTPIAELTDDHDIFWFLQKSTKRTKLRLIYYALVAFCVIVTLSYNLGTNKVVNLLVDSAARRAQEDNHTERTQEPASNPNQDTIKE